MRPTTYRAALVIAAVVSLLAPAIARATASPEQIEKSRNEGVTYLKGLQKASGEIPGFGGDWALTSFAAADVAPAEVNKGGEKRPMPAAGMKASSARRAGPEKGPLRPKPSEAPCLPMPPASIRPVSPSVRI